MINLEKEKSKLQNKIFYLKMMKIVVETKNISSFKEEYDKLIQGLVTWYKLTQ